MSIRVIVQVQAKQETKDELEELLKKVIQRLRIAVGCREAKLYQEMGNTLSYLLYELWEGNKPHETFLKELREDGTFGQLANSLSSSIKAETLEEVSKT